ncbi:MAG: phosphatidate cytidylyltransferase, partial [Nevskiales bacterium]
MLMQRVISALVLIPPVVAAVWFLPTTAISAVLAVFFLIGAWEWSQLMRLQATLPRVTYVVTMAAVFATLYVLRHVPDLKLAILGLALLWWVSALLWVIRYPAGLQERDSRQALKAVIGLVLLGPAFLALILLHAREQGPLW